jgi:TonB family protein
LKVVLAKVIDMAAHGRIDEELQMTHSLLRIVSTAGALTLGLSTAAGATSVRLVPLGGTTIGASVSCKTSDRPAAISGVAYPVLPAIADGQHVSGITTLRIDLDATGRLTREEVLNSSGNRWIDNAARESARLSGYRSEVRNCASVAGAYALVVDFT